ncbi:hypothetical protein DSO57_1035916 [Entomophthora muscae]|uniref:Uncharacterized protein n=2 Tax=Entomophthora muscae TaxID=34485 RepID=A0ACC2TLU3_9FUNG|nr:hypothetical protein DSO57_1035916 [Entomophthora muscae]
MGSAKKALLGHQLIQAHRVVELLGCQDYEASPRATRIGLYQELQYNRKGKLAGFKTLIYHKELTTATNNMVFHWLLANHAQLDRDELFRLGLHLSDGFDYVACDSSRSRRITRTLEEMEMGHPCQLGMDAALKAVGIRKRARHHMYQVLAIILHLGNVEFASDSDGKAAVAEMQRLDFVGELMGVPTPSLESTLTTRTRYIGSELCTMLLSVDEAYAQRDQLSRTIFNLLLSWVVEAMNQSFCCDSDDGLFFISMLDQPGYCTTNGSFDTFSANFINEKLHLLVLEHHLGGESSLHRDMAQANLPIPQSAFSRDCMDMLTGETATGGLVGLLEDITHEYAHHPRRNGTDPAQSSQRLSWVDPASYTVNEITSRFSHHPAFHAVPQVSATHSNTRISFSANAKPTFAIAHFFGDAEYQAQDNYGYFIDANCDHISPDFVTLFRNESENPFLVDLFYHPLLATSQPNLNPNLNLNPNPSTITVAQLPNQMVRLPKHESIISPSTSTLAQMSTGLAIILQTVAQSTIRHVLHLHGPDISRQVEFHRIPELAQASRIDWACAMDVDDMYLRYLTLIPIPRRSNKDASDRACKLNLLISNRGWGMDECIITPTRVFLAFSAWRELEDSLRRSESAHKSSVKSQPLLHSPVRRPPPSTEWTSRIVNIFHSQGNIRTTYPSTYAFPVPSAANSATSSNEEIHDVWQHLPLPTSRMSLPYNQSWETFNSVTTTGEHLGIPDHAIPEKPSTSFFSTNERPVTRERHSLGRQFWIAFSYLVTFWMPGCCLGMRGIKHRTAWREKAAICTLLLLFWLIVLFFATALGPILCPWASYVSLKELASHARLSDAYVAIHGNVYDVSSLAEQDHGGRGAMSRMVGTDVTASFPVAIPLACPGLVTDMGVALNVTVDYLHAQAANPEPTFPWVNENSPLLPSKVGQLVYSPEQLAISIAEGSRQWAAINGRVYDLTPLFSTIAVQSWDERLHFLPPTIEAMFGSIDHEADVTSTFENDLELSENERQATLECLDGAFYAGVLDPRLSTTCQASNFLPLILGWLLAAASIFKLLIPRRSASREVGPYHQYVVCHLSCYTEGEEALRPALESLAELDHPDDHKLIFITADGMMIGSNNDLPTPRIILEILGSDPLGPDPAPHSYLGLGKRGHNMAKVYSGHFEHNGHCVPYIMVCKVGRPSERVRPGQRGAGDSQALLLSFFSHAHLNQPMSPLELEIYRQMDNCLDLRPTAFQYLLAVDAQTRVDPPALGRLLDEMHDGIIGVSGTVRIANPRDSWATIMMAYHHAAPTSPWSLSAKNPHLALYRICLPPVDNVPIPLLANPHLIQECIAGRGDKVAHLPALVTRYLPGWKMAKAHRARCSIISPTSLISYLKVRASQKDLSLPVRMVSYHPGAILCLLLSTLGPPIILYLVYLIYLVFTRPTLPLFITLIILTTIPILALLPLLLRRKWTALLGYLAYLPLAPFLNFMLVPCALYSLDLSNNPKHFAADSPNHIPLTIYSPSMSP